MHCLGILAYISSILKIHFIVTYVEGQGFDIFTGKWLWMFEIEGDYAKRDWFGLQWAIQTENNSRQV